VISIVNIFTVLTPLCSHCWLTNRKEIAPVNIVGSTESPKCFPVGLSLTYGGR